MMIIIIVLSCFSGRTDARITCSDVTLRSLGLRGPVGFGLSRFGFAHVGAGLLARSLVFRESSSKSLCLRTSRTLGPYGLSKACGLGATAFGRMLSVRWYHDKLSSLGGLDLSSLTGPPLLLAGGCALRLLRLLPPVGVPWVLLLGGGE